MGDMHVQSQFPAYRVFIYGYEVTADVTAVVLNSSDGEYPNTCAITLTSTLDKYLVTVQDLINIGNAVTIPGLSIIDPTGAKFGPSVPGANVVHSPVYVRHAAKDQIMAQKRSAPAATVTVNMPAGSSLPDRTITATKYPFQVGKPIFHPNDPVRVFERDPSDPNIWYYMFTGLVSDFAEEVDANDNNVLTIVAESAAKHLRYGRFTSNPGYVDLLNQQVKKAITDDVAVRTVFANLFANLTLAEIFFAMLFGISAFDETPAFQKLVDQQRQSLLAGGPAHGTLDSSTVFTTSPSTTTDSVQYAWGKGTLRQYKHGVGHLDLGKSMVFQYGDTNAKGQKPTSIPPQMSWLPITALATYQQNIDHRVKSEDINGMRGDVNAGGTPLPVPSDIPSIIKAIGEHPEIYPTDGGRLMMLIPESLVDSREIVTRDLAQTFAANTEWSTRAQVLRNVVERIQFVFYVSPRGDFCVEFPLVDFDPADFGEFAPNYIVGLDSTPVISTAFSDSKVMTMAVCAHNFVQNMEVGGDPNEIPGFQQVVTLWTLIPVYGVRTVPITPQGYIASADGANVYASICLNRLNADAYTQQVRMPPRLTTWLNRPHYVQKRNHIGTTKSITHTITWGANGEVGTTLGLNDMRGWDGSITRDGRMLFTPLGGAASKPFSYARIFSKDDPATP